MPGARLLLVVAALANARCATTTRAPVGAPAASAWLAEHDGRGAAVRFKPPWNSTLRGQLTRESPALPAVQLPPTQTRLRRSVDERAIPLAWVRDVKVASHARGAGEGALLGASAGIVCGVVFGLLATDFGRTIGCSEGRSCHDRDLPRAFAGGLGYGLIITGPIGAALGAVLGGLIGHRYVLTFD
jgi:hypothetical protein